MASEIKCKTAVSETFIFLLNSYLVELKLCMDWLNIWTRSRPSAFHDFRLSLTSLREIFGIFLVVG